MKLHSPTDTLFTPSPRTGGYFSTPLRRTSSIEGLPSLSKAYNDKLVFQPKRNAPGTLEDVIPNPHTTLNRRRTLVLCFDGTGDQFDEDNSNVVQFFSLLKKDDPTQQLTYYQAGIGTYTIPQIAKPMSVKFHKLLDMMVGLHLDAHVMGGYEFLMQNYKSGDKICLFGFSRGAYTARALAGMIHKIGLLPRCNHQQVPFAYKMYSREDEKGWQQSGLFKQSFSIDVDIEFLGVWDTVDSVGVIPKGLPFVTTNTHVRYFRHAIALDERRTKFQPNFWKQQTKECGLPPGSMPKSNPRQENREGYSFGSWMRSETQTQDYEAQYTEDGDLTTNVKEVWFAGCHADVGGGAVANETRNSLARIPLRWMIRQCFELDTGILFHKEMLKIVGLDPSTLYPFVQPRPPAMSVPSSTLSHVRVSTVGKGMQKSSMSSRMDFWTSDFVNEEEEDLKDALSPINDMLTKKWFWWILELLPQRMKYQDERRTRL